MHPTQWPTTSFRPATVSERSVSERSFTTRDRLHPSFRRTPESRGTVAHLVRRGEPDGLDLS